MPPVDPIGRVALVTGAGKRLGRAIALDLAAAGCRVVVHYRSSEAEARDTAATIAAAGGEASVLQADLATPTGPGELVAAACALYGRLDVVVGCAAVFRRTPWAEADLAAWQYHMDGNLTAAYLLARAAADCLEDGGSIVTFGDWSGVRPYRDFLPYCVSKAGVIALTQALAQELAPRIRVNCVCPGTVLPPDGAPDAKVAAIAAQTPLGRIGSPADIVAAVRFLTLGSDFTTGVILPVDGGRLIANGTLY